ncbi:uncharacterized protein LOC109873722 isoform X2 [Oncorhynchus kisutch]|nr:uncharacterized protein LOC109873722 isoform X2 [Oncorhynchus kisutch]
MITSSPRFTWCDCRKHKIPIKDTNELCLHCLGIQHAKEAVLEYGKCPQCAKMDWSTCINRLTKVQEIMHHERRHEAAQSEVKLKSETTSAPIKEPKLGEDPVPILPPPRLSTTTPVYSSTMPVLFTILSLQTGPNSSIPKDTFLSQLAIQQSADSTPSMSPHADFQGSANYTISQNAARAAPITPNGATVASSGDALHPPRLPPPTDFCPSGKWRRSQRESRQAVRLERRHRELVEMVQQRLEASNRPPSYSVQFWRSALRLWRGKVQKLLCHTPLQPKLHIFMPPSLVSGKRAERLISHTIVKQEEEPSISSALSPLRDVEGEDASLSTDGPISKQDLLAAKELQSLIA